MYGKLTGAWRAVPLLILAATLSCSDPHHDVLPSSSSEFLFDQRYRHLAETDRLAILKYYDRRNTFSSVAAIPLGTTVAAALAEQRTYETINLTASPGGQGISSQTGEPTHYFGVTLHTSKQEIGAVVGLSGVIALVDDFDQVLLNQEVRVDRPYEKSEYLLAELWLRMSPKQEQIISKLDYQTLGLCFQPGLKLKHDDGSIATVDFPLCYKRSKKWTLSPKEKLDRVLRQQR